jgi:hypothetical protein
MRILVISLILLFSSSACVKKAPAPDANSDRGALSFQAPDLLSQDEGVAYERERAWIERLRETSAAGAAYAGNTEASGAAVTE